MKKLILIAMAFVSLQSIAQDREKGNRKHKAEMMQNLSAEDIATLGAKKMTLKLDLSDAQQAEVKNLLLEEATFRKEKMEARKEEKEADDFQRPTKEERLKMQNERLDRQIEMKQKMKSILDDEQYAEWETNLSEKKSHHKKSLRSKERRKK